MEAQTSSAIRQHLNPKLIRSLRLFGIIFVVMLAVILFDIVQGTITVLLALAGLLLGMVVGMVLARMKRITWDEASATVIAQMDMIGGIILVLYIVLIFVRNWFFGHWAEGPALTAMSLSFTAGTMLGRIVGTRRGIARVLNVWNIPLKS